MIECIFSLDYEVRGDGSGSLRDLVYDPAEKLAEVFRRANARFVPFVEVAELEIIESAGTDAAIDLVKRQLREFYAQGFTPGLHLHPQWYGAKFENGQWVVDYSEYNLCTLPRQRIEHIVDRALAYFKRVLGDPGFTPLSFRAGNWLFQPTEVAADVLFDRGIRIDSSVFKGGVRHEHRLDYRHAPRQEYLTGGSAHTPRWRIPPAHGSNCPSTRRWFHSGGCPAPNGSAWSASTSRRGRSGKSYTGSGTPRACGTP